MTSMMKNTVLFQARSRFHAKLIYYITFGLALNARVLLSFFVLAFFEAGIRQ